MAFCYFGEGSTSRGDWHEGVNFATVQKLPVVFICNNNQYAYSTPLGLQMACANVADRGPAYNMPAEIVDGNDVLAVHEATRRAVDHARSGNGPYLLECKTFRMTGHSAHDAAHYVPKDLFEEWGKLDPITRFEARMLAEGWAAQAEIDELHAAVHREVDEARGVGRAEPLSRPRNPARRRLREPITMSTTYLEAIREGLWEEMERDPNVFLIGRGHRRIRRRFQSDRGLLRTLRRDAAWWIRPSPKRPSWARPSAPRSWGCARWPKCSSPTSSPAASTRS